MIEQQRDELHVQYSNPQAVAKSISNRFDPMDDNPIHQVRRTPVGWVLKEVVLAIALAHSVGGGKGQDALTYNFGIQPAIKSAPSVGLRVHQRGQTSAMSVGSKTRLVHLCR